MCGLWPEVWVNFRSWAGGWCRGFCPVRGEVLAVCCARTALPAAPGWRRAAVRRRAEQRRQDSENRPTHVGVVRPFLPFSSCPQDVPSGIRAPTLAACPQPSHIQALHACPPIHPSVCLLLTSVSMGWCPGWPGAGLQASWKECGGHTGSSHPSPEKAPWPHVQSWPGVPGSCSALGLVAVVVSLPQCPEWGWPAGQATGWMRGD